MLGLNGGLIGPRRDVLPVASVPGVWTAQEQVMFQRSATWPGNIFFGAAGSYSLRDLAGNGSTTVVRVRRSSDNNEMDFKAAEVSDGTLAAWVGTGGDGFVRTWYDQGLNGNHFQQATAAAQPKLVSAGAVLTRNSRPIIEFGAGKELTGSIILGAAQAYICAMYHPATVTTGNHYLITQGTVSSFWGFGSMSTQIANERHGVTTSISGTTRGYFQATANINAGSYCYSFTWNGTDTAVIYQNTTIISASVLNGGFGPTTDPASITALGRSANPASFEAHEFIFYNSDVSAAIGSMQANLIDYYGIS